MKVAFLGATKGIGRALARLLAERGDTLFLLGRTPAEIVAGLAAESGLDDDGARAALEQAEAWVAGSIEPLTPGGVRASR